MTHVSPELLDTEHVTFSVDVPHVDHRIVPMQPTDALGIQQQLPLFPEGSGFERCVPVHMIRKLRFLPAIITPEGEESVRLSLPEESGESGFGFRGRGDGENVSETRRFPYLILSPGKDSRSWDVTVPHDEDNPLTPEEVNLVCGGMVVFMTKAQPKVPHQRPAEAQSPLILPPGFSR